MNLTPAVYPLLQTENLRIGYKLNKRQVNYLTGKLKLNLNVGDFVCLIGPNGTGKSTLIRNLCGIDTPLEGNVFVDGKNINNYSIRELSQAIGCVLTDKSAIDQITVEEIVSLGRYFYSGWLGKLNPINLLKVQTAIEQVGLKGFNSRNYGTLSDGEKQRTFIAKLLCSDARVLLLDEPTAHLDIPNKVEIMTLLRRLTRETGCSVLVSTHDLDLAIQLADELWLMSPNRDIFTGAPEELLMTDKLDTAFGSQLLSFNSHSGSFSIQFKKTGTIHIKGDGPLSTYTRIALTRLGINADPSPAGNTILEIDENHKLWKLIFDGETIVFSNLSNICRFLRHYNF